MNRGMDRDDGAGNRGRDEQPLRLKAWVEDQASEVNQATTAPTKREATPPFTIRPSPIDTHQSTLTLALKVVRDGEIGLSAGAGDDPGAEAGVALARIRVNARSDVDFVRQVFPRDLDA